MKRLLDWPILSVVWFALAACTAPYSSPVIVTEPGQRPNADFRGMKDLITRDKPIDAPAQVLWTHGMCSHDPTWARDRIERVAAVLNAPWQITAGSPPIDGEPYYLNATFGTPNGDLTVTFLIWSPMTDHYKQQLTQDQPGPDGNRRFPYTRATLNGQLKTGLMNDCLADAVVYSGKNGDAIRGAMRQAVCNFLGGVLRTDRGPCDLSGVQLNRPTAIVTESLGSKFIFDAVRSIWEDAQQAPLNRVQLERRLASISTVYMAANQIPLLDLANPIDALGTIGTSGPNRSSLGKFAAISNQRRAELGAPPLTIVDFSDPNDLLTYRLLPGNLDVSAQELVNVTVSNDPTYFGFLEWPNNAHCGYAWNRDVIGLIANGYHGGPIPTAPALKQGECL